MQVRQVRVKQTRRFRGTVLDGGGEPSSKRGTNAIVERASKARGGVQQRPRRRGGTPHASRAGSSRPTSRSARGGRGFFVAAGVLFARLLALPGVHLAAPPALHQEKPNERVHARHEPGGVEQPGGDGRVVSSRVELEREG